MMSPTIQLVRHAQGLHNVAGNYDLRDPLLTPLGHQQCLELQRASFPEQANISLIVASPLCRALQTAIGVFGPALAGSTNNNALKIIALPELQETSDDACDTGSDPEDLRKIVEQSNWPVDLSRVSDGYNNKSPGSSYGPDAGAIRARARVARSFLREKARQLTASGEQDVHIAVVSHGGFLHFLTDDWEDAALRPGTGWANCETRAYVFEQGDDGGDDCGLRLVETLDSRLRRGRVGPAKGREEQPELFRLAMKAWGRQGLQRPDLVGKEARDGAEHGTDPPQELELNGSLGIELKA